MQFVGTLVSETANARVVGMARSDNKDGWPFADAFARMVLFEGEFELIRDGNANGSGVVFEVTDRAIARVKREQVRKP